MEGREGRAKDRSEQHGPLGEVRRWSKGCGKDRVERLGDEMVGAKEGIPTPYSRKCGTRASFSARIDT